MRCKNCDRVRHTHGRYVCWQYDLCGTCFQLLMPEKCKSNQIREYAIRKRKVNIK